MSFVLNIIKDIIYSSIQFKLVEFFRYSCGESGDIDHLIPD